MAEGKQFEIVGANLEAFEDTESKEFLLAGPAGTGKAQPLTEAIMTPSGIRSMVDIRVGDDVLAADGTVAKVTGCYPQGMRRVYRVRFSCGRSVRATADHLWTVWRLAGKSGKGRGVRPEQETLTTHELAGRLTIGKKASRLRYWVAAPEPAKFFARTVPIPAYILGVWIGDGSPVCSDRGSAQFTTADEFVADEVARELTDDHRVERVGAIQYRIRAPYKHYRSSSPHPYFSTAGDSVRLAVRTLNKTRHVGTFASRAQAIKAFSEQPELAATPRPLPYQHRIAGLGLSNCLAHEKFVPEEYLVNDVAVRLAIVQGLMDTDGTVDRKTGMPSFCTTSRRLARDFRFLIESLGGGVTIRAKRTSHRVAFICHVRFDDPSHLFRLPRKRSLCKKRTKYPFRRWVESVREDGVEECQCIAIDHPQRLYLTKGFIPTHNTFTNLLKLLNYGQDYPGARMLIIRKTRASLTETALVTWEQHILGDGHPIIGNPINRDNRRSYKFPNGTVLVTGGMDRPDKILSSEYDMIYVPEATDLDLLDWETLGGRLRAGAGPYDQLFGDCNPTSPAHWLYKRCLAGDTKLYETFHWENPRYYDNLARQWTPEGRRYVGGRLEKMTGARRDRFLKGKWVAAEGLVYAFEAGIHLKPNDWRPDPSWPRVWALDWGLSAPTVLLMAAYDGDGRAYFYREVYQTHLRADVLGKRAKSLVDSGAEPRPQAAVCDHDEDAKALFEKASGIKLTMADKTDRDRGIQDMQGRFDLAEDDRPRIYFREGMREDRPDPVLVNDGRPTCCLEELTGYIFDPRMLRDEPIAENDHALDAARYACRWIDKRYGDMKAGDFYGSSQPPPARPSVPGTFRGR